MDYTVKEMPESERPREKLEEKGSGALTDAELVAILLGTGTEGKNALELAWEVLEGDTPAELANRSPGELESFEGISTAKASRLVAAGELSRRMSRSTREKLEEFPDVREAVEDMKVLEEELLRVFHLNSGNEVLQVEEFSGSADSLNFTPRKLFGPALECGATAAIIAHNHPSGKAEPTEQDLAATRRLIEAGRSLGIELLDHVVVGEETTSMRRKTDLWEAH